jgi:hypothetical protein
MARMPRGSRHAKTLASGEADAVAVVHQDHIGMYFDGERYSVFLACLTAGGAFGCLNSLPTIAGRITR